MDIDMDICSGVFPISALSAMDGNFEINRSDGAFPLKLPYLVCFALFLFHVSCLLVVEFQS